MNSSSSMIERVGRALAKEEGYAYDPLPYDARARAAIAAMGEPTEAMILAGHGANLCENAPEVWVAMLDEALK